MSYDLPPHPRTFPDQSEEWYRTHELDYWRKVDEVTRRRVDSILTGAWLRASEAVSTKPEQFIRWCPDCQIASGPYPATDDRSARCGACLKYVRRFPLYPPVSD